MQKKFGCLTKVITLENTKKVLHFRKKYIQRDFSMKLLTSIYHLHTKKLTKQKRKIDFDPYDNAIGTFDEEF